MAKSTAAQVQESHAEISKRIKTAMDEARASAETDGVTDPGAVKQLALDARKSVLDEHRAPLEIEPVAREQIRARANARAQAEREGVTDPVMIEQRELDARRRVLNEHQAQQGRGVGT